MKLIKNSTGTYTPLPKKVTKKQRIKVSFKEVVMRKHFGQEWEKLSEIERVQLRAQRAKAGIKCNICGAMGYYRETCPNKCTIGDKLFQDERPDTPPTPPPPPSVGIHWGDTCAEDPKKETLGNLFNLKNEEQVYLKGKDQELMRYEYFDKAQDGYNRNIAEMTLHQVLRYLVRIVDIEAKHTAATLDKSLDNDTTLFHPPRQPVGKEFYPEEMVHMKEYRDYYYSLKNKPDLVTRAYNNRSSLRVEKLLDPILRGGDVHAQRVLFMPNPDANRPIHAQLGWKDITCKNDDLAIGDAAMVVREQEFKKNFSKQSAWVTMQRESMEHRSERFAHLALIIRDEISKEHQREVRMLEIPFGDKRASDHAAQLIWKERIDSADRIMKTLSAYSMGISGSCEADYLMFCLDVWIKASSKGKKSWASEHLRMRSKGYKDVDDKSADDDEDDESSLIMKLKGAKSKQRGQKKADSGAGEGDENSSVALSLNQERLVHTYMTQEVRDLHRIKKETDARYQKAAEKYRKAREAERKAADRALKLMNGSNSTISSGDVDDNSTIKTTEAMSALTGNSVPPALPLFAVPSASEWASISLKEDRMNKYYNKSVEIVEPTESITYQWHLMAGKKPQQINNRKSSPLNKPASPVKNIPKHGELALVTEISANNSSNGNFNAHRNSDDVTDTSPSAAEKKTKSFSQMSLAIAESAAQSADKKNSLNTAVHKKLNPRELPLITNIRKVPTQRQIDDKKMKDLAGVFRRIGLDQNIRAGNFQDSSQFSPAIIPLHEVIHIDPIEEQMISHTAVKTMIDQREKYIKANTGYAKRKYAPLFSRTTLFESNGCTPGGDQRYTDMADNRRYSYLLGRAMSSLEPKGTKHEF